MFADFFLEDIFKIEGFDLALIGKLLRGEIFLGYNFVFHSKHYQVSGIEVSKEYRNKMTKGEQGAVFVTGLEKDYNLIKNLKGQIIHFEN